MMGDRREVAHQGEGVTEVMIAWSKQDMTHHWSSDVKDGIVGWREGRRWCPGILVEKVQG